MYVLFISKLQWCKSFYQRAREQLQVADRMVADILQLSQVAAAEIVINPHPCELPEIIQSAFWQVEDMLQKKQQHVTFDLPQDLPWFILTASECNKW